MEDTLTKGPLPPGVYRSKIPFWRLLTDQAAITQEVLEYDFPGNGTEDDPYVVSWIPNDNRNPMLFGLGRKVAITLIVASCTLTVSLTSSVYSGSVSEITAYFNVSDEVATIGLSLFVLGFAVGPLLWAPFSEVFGRQLPFFFSCMGMAAFSAGCAGAQNIWTLCILRFFAGAFGSAPFTNAGGTISDMFAARQRGLALSLYAAAPFLGPAIGPIIGGFLGMRAGWRWVEGFLAALAGFIWLLMAISIPETYAPRLLRLRADRLSQLTGRVYRSKVELDKGTVSLPRLLKTTMSRPWVLLFREPIVLLFALYIAIVYGTLYMFFAAFPIVYEDVRGWNPGVGGLAFLGIAVGMILGLHARGVGDPDQPVLVRVDGLSLHPLDRQHHCYRAVRVRGYFDLPRRYYYLIDSYTIYAASVLAANTVLRSIFGAVFPIIAPYMYDGVGIHWAPSIPAFLSLLCMPAPFLFYKYGAMIRTHCKYSAESDRYMRKLQENAKRKSEVVEKERPVKDEPMVPADGEPGMSQAAEQK
nr:bicyclomycin resistance protein [Aspergillus niger CBS 513.88]|eukprot:XP_001396016.2 bicyclomycin resistance protein [Aspergillus niger CBS 513.88]